MNLGTNLSATPTMALVGTNVGIGTTAPTNARLEVIGGIPSLFTADSTASSPTYGGSIFYRNHTGVGQGNGLIFSLNNASGTRSEYAYIGGVIETNTAGSHNGGIIFAPASSGNRTEQVRITNIGTAIGTTAPILTSGDRGNLTINGSGASILTLASAGTFNMYIYSTSSFNEIYSTPKLWLGTAGSTRISIETNGNVLIGTTTDNGSKFQVNGTTSLLGTTALHDNLLRVRAMSDANHAIVYNGTINGPLSYGYWGSGLGYTEGGSANITLMTYQDQVLIGYTTPQGYKLAVNGQVIASAYFESSDAKLKNINKSYDSSNFGTYEFTWKDKRDNKNHWGYVAQEVETYLPDAVSIGGDGFLAVDYNQAHTYKIAKVEDEVTLLKKRVAELEQQLNLN